MRDRYEEETLKDKIYNEGFHYGYRKAFEDMREKFKKDIDNMFANILKETEEY